MNVTNITAMDYDNNIDSNSSNDYNNVTNFCTNIENITDIPIPTILLTIPCGLSFLCLISLTVYTLIKHLITNK